jgi:hypothetical protein
VKCPSSQPEGCCFRSSRQCCCGLHFPGGGCLCWTLLPLHVFLFPKLPPGSVEVPRADLRALCIAVPSVAMSRVRLSRSRNVVAIRKACDMRCGSIFGPERCAMIGELQSRYSGLLSAAVWSLGMPNPPDPRNTPRSSMSSSSRHMSSA